MEIFFYAFISFFAYLSVVYRFKSIEKIKEKFYMALHRMLVAKYL